MGTPVSVSVVIPAYNEEKVIEETLRTVIHSLDAVDEWKGAYEVIVCDNNSTDRTAEIAAGFGVKVVFEPVNQIARARNAGAAAASGQWLIFIDADTRPTPELMRRLSATLGKPRLVAGGGRFAMKGIDPVARLFLFLFSVWSYLCRYPGGGFLFCSREAFYAVGAFDIEYFAAEEIFLFRKLQKHARASRGKIVMLWTPPIETSPRKLTLYTPREILKLLWRALTRSRRTLTSREQCHLWYDGRR